MQVKMEMAEMTETKERKDKCLPALCHPKSHVLFAQLE